MIRLFRIIAILVLFLMAGHLSIAQQTSLRISIGPTYSKPVVKNTSGIPNTNSFKNYSDAVVSLMIQRTFKKNIGIVLDMGICHRGLAITQPTTRQLYHPANASYYTQDEKNNYRHELSYWDNHLMGKYTIGNTFRTYVNAGIYYSMLTKSRKYITDEYYSYSGLPGPLEVHGVHAGNMHTFYKNADYGLSIGTGIEYKRFGVDYRYSRGLVNISKHPDILKIYSSFSTVKITFVLVRVEKTVLPHVLHLKRKSAR